VDNNYLDLGMSKSGFIHTLPSGRLSGADVAAGAELSPESSRKPKSPPAHAREIQRQTTPSWPGAPPPRERLSPLDCAALALVLSSLVETWTRRHLPSPRAPRAAPYPTCERHPKPPRDRATAHRRARHRSTGAALEESVLPSAKRACQCRTHPLRAGF
jgi:hypothetical protein